MTPKVSIIVPVYNVEKFLPRCLDSLLTQTLIDIEIVCINDGSTDGSLQVLHTYAKKDSRIRIISQPNKGLGGARNTGIDASNGTYILFVDSDDWIDSHSCERLYKVASRYDADMACGSILKTYPTRKPKWVERYTEESIFASAQRRFDALPCPPCFNIVQKLIKREVLLLNALRFEEGVPFEDVEYIAHLLSAVDWMITVPDAVYHYVVRNGSICRSRDSIQRQKQLYAVHKRLIDYIDRIGVVIKPEHRWIRKRVYGFWGLHLLYVWERDGLEEFRLFKHIIIYRRTTPKG